MAFNVKLAKKVRKLIAEEPKRLQMRVWGKRLSKTAANRPPCRTVACLAGWTILANLPRKQWPKAINNRESTIYYYAQNQTEKDGYDPPASLAARLLGLKVNECPFWETGMTAPEVLAWLDKRIAKATSK